MTGYQLHVRTFTLHTVLKTVADSYKPPNPPSVDVRTTKPPPTPPSTPSPSSGTPASTSMAGSITNHAEAMDVLDEAAPAIVGAGAVVPAVPGSLVKPAFDACIPEIVELLMEDLFGETAAAKEVSE